MSKEKKLMLLKELPHRQSTPKRDDTNSLESCTCRGPQNTYQTSHNSRKNDKNEEKTLFKGAYASFTTDRLRVIRGLTI